MLPAANFTETSGTYVNAEGYWQSFRGILEPGGEARPAWKILRVLGNLTGVDGFDYLSSEDVKNEVRSQCESVELSNAISSSALVNSGKSTGSRSTDICRASDVPMYAVDAVVRRAASLQNTVDAQSLCVRINSAEAERLGVSDQQNVMVNQGENSAELPLVIDDSIPDASAWIPSAVEGNDLLGEAFAVISIKAMNTEAVEA
jgi:NADH-quinone oxidoreductase subunit G